MAELPPALLAYVIRCFGAPIRSERCSGTTADVWRIVLVDRAPIVVKRCGPGRGFGQELAALQRVSALGEAVPQLVAHDPELRVIVTLELGAADAIAPTPALWHAAGRLRAALDRIDPGPADPCPLERAIALRTEHWLGRARTHLDAEILARARAAFDPRAFAGRERRLCHRDYGPHNWRIDPARPGWIGCVDFGHARADDPLVDLVRACAPPHDDPGLAVEFLAGWGLAPEDRTTACIRQLAWLHAVATATWGREHGDPAFTALGDAALARCAR